MTHKKSSGFLGGIRFQSSFTIRWELEDKIDIICLDDSLKYRIMAIKTNENFIPFSNNVTFRKPRGTDLVTASELIPGFCRSKSNVPTPGSLYTIKSPTAGIVPGIKSPPLARTPPPPPPHGIYVDRCINSKCIDWNESSHSSPSNLCSTQPKHKHFARQQIHVCQQNVDWAQLDAHLFRYE